MDPADSYSVDSRSIQSLMQAERKLLDPKSGQLHTAVDISCQNVIPAALKGAHQRYVEQGRIRYQYWLRTDRQGRNCPFFHTCQLDLHDRPMDTRTDG